MRKKLVLSTLAKTWILDIDGTLLKHNGFLTGGDVVLPGVKEFYANIAPDDMVILLTARNHEDKEYIEKFLRENGLRFDQIIYDAPVGERILVNDKKPSGLKTAYAINTKRDSKLEIKTIIDKNL
ncbi:MAG: hypothetical protein LUD39_05230 [Opitutae bacterium]|nr:hypothetical protein [Opitutae bacterium]